MWANMGTFHVSEPLWLTLLEVQACEVVIDATCYQILSPSTRLGADVYWCSTTGLWHCISMVIELYGVRDMGLTVPRIWSLQFPFLHAVVLQVRT